MHVGRLHFVALSFLGFQIERVRLMMATGETDPKLHAKHERPMAVVIVSAAVTTYVALASLGSLPSAVIAR